MQILKCSFEKIFILTAALLPVLLFGDLKTFAKNVFGSKAQNHIEKALFCLKKTKKKHVAQP